MTRSIPISLAPVLEHLELEQTEIVTLKQLEAIAREAGVRTAPALIAHRLLGLGWLLRTGLNGAWEFAPGAHAGPFTRGGPLVPVKAALALDPDLPARLALTSAAWAYGFADRTPSKIELAVAPGRTVAAGLARRVTVLRFDTRLKPIERRGVPVHRVESVLVHMAARPSHVTSWGGVAEWIGDLVAEAMEADVRLELAGRPRAVRVRLAYLLQGMWPKLAEQLGDDGSSKVWFGSRRKLRRHSQRWHVADTLLPFDPAKLAPVRRT
ncbi:MAG: type IV toxin-antitoxin system AbiEi family antitoxin [Planctomycetota bacterium]